MGIFFGQSFDTNDDGRPDVFIGVHYDTAANPRPRPAPTGDLTRIEGTTSAVWFLFLLGALGRLISLDCPQGWNWIGLLFGLSLVVPYLFTAVLFLDEVCGVKDVLHPEDFRQLFWFQALIACVGVDWFLFTTEWSVLPWLVGSIITLATVVLFVWGRVAVNRWYKRFG